VTSSSWAYETTRTTKLTLILKYLPDEARNLKAYKELPENIRLNEGVAGDMEDDGEEADDDFVDFEGQKTSTRSKLASRPDRGDRGVGTVTPVAESGIGSSAGRRRLLTSRRNIRALGQGRTGYAWCSSRGTRLLLSSLPHSSVYLLFSDCSFWGLASWLGVFADTAAAEICTVLRSWSSTYGSQSGAEPVYYAT